MFTNNIMNSSNDIMINPLTQKPIKIGGRVYIKLVNDGVISAHNDLLKNELDTYDNDEDAEDLINTHNEILKEVTPKLQAVRGRGKHQNKIVVRHKKEPYNLGKLYKQKEPEYFIQDEEGEMSEIDMNNLDSD